jgi:phage tail-like protein
MPNSDLLLPRTFYFTVKFSTSMGNSDTSFKEVSGIKKVVSTEEYNEGGENAYVFKLPKKVTYTPLVLKRGIAKLDSPLVKWCKSIMESTVMDSVCCMPLWIYLMDENSHPIRGWSFVNAFPIVWEVETFDSLKNEVAIESITFEYQYSSRII